MKCIECDNQRNANRGDGRLRTRCKDCWNKYCRINRINHLKYFSDYINNYIADKRLNDDFKKHNNTINNKSNKKAISELKDSYIKNRITNGKKWGEDFSELIESKRLLIKIHRHGKNRVQH